MYNDISLVFDGIGSVGALYISNTNTANNPRILQKHNIKTVITAAKGQKINDKEIGIQKYLYLQIGNKQDIYIERYFNKAFDFIEEARKSSNILVHCQTGTNQSVAIVITYLIRKYRYSLSQTFTLIKTKRQKIEPNPRLIEKLQSFSKKYSINHDSSKPKYLRASSFEVGSKSSIKQIYQNHLLINSDVLKRSQSKFQQNQILSEQEQQKISSVRRQREQIEYKLRNLSYGLIRGRNINNSLTTPSSKLKSLIRIETFGQSQNGQEMSENINPNQPLQIQNMKWVISDEVQERAKVKLKYFKKPSYQSKQMTVSIELKE